MKIIKNKIIPFGGKKAINLFGFVFTKGELSDVYKNHELIHTKQMKWLFYLPFYLIYGVEWLIKLLKYWNGHKAYKNISFEREAYGHQSELEDVLTRKPYAQWTK